MGASGWGSHGLCPVHFPEGGGIVPGAERLLPRRGGELPDRRTRVVRPCFWPPQSPDCAQGVGRSLLKKIEPHRSDPSETPRQGLAGSAIGATSGREPGVGVEGETVLLEEAYLEERDRLLYLRDPGKLLQGWAAQYRPHVKRLQLFAIARPAETETRLAEWCRTNGITYALTQLSAAWRYSPFVRYDKSLVYIDKKVESGTNLKSLLSHIDAREVDTGANCTLWITDDPAVFSDSREVDGVKVVSPLQLYLDLKVLAGRGEDAAQEILEKELHTLLPDSRHKSEQSHGGEQ